MIIWYAGNKYSYAFAGKNYIERYLIDAHVIDENRLLKIKLTLFITRKIMRESRLKVIIEKERRNRFGLF